MARVLLVLEVWDPVVTVKFIQDDVYTHGQWARKYDFISLFTAKLKRSFNTFWPLTCTNMVIETSQYGE